MVKQSPGVEAARAKDALQGRGEPLYRLSGLTWAVRFVVAFAMGLRKELPPRPL
jgi:hypothetical protein